MSKVEGEGLLRGVVSVFIILVISLKGFFKEMKYREYIE